MRRRKISRQFSWKQSFSNVGCAIKKKKELRRENKRTVSSLTQKNVVLSNGLKQPFSTFLAFIESENAP